MNHHQANELMPCAHCGNKAIKTSQSGDERNGYAQRVQISCTVCGARIGAVGDTSKGGYADNSTVEARVITAWNRRAAPTEPAVDRDAVAWRHYLPDNRYFGNDPTKTFQTLDTLDEADEELGIHGGTVVPLFAAPDRASTGSATSTADGEGANG